MICLSINVSVRVQRTETVIERIANPAAPMVVKKPNPTRPNFKPPPPKTGLFEIESKIKLYPHAVGRESLLVWVISREDFLAK